ncbi:MAG: hypothetical protein WCA20_32915 [Candidatus Sulfotelmatobacter sp.]
MTDFTPSSFGHPSRHYSAPHATRDCEGDQRLGSQVAKLLQEYDKELVDKVRRTLKQWNNVIRDQLRNEMGLRLTVGDDAQAVPLRVVDGMPAMFGDLLSSLDPTVWGFLLRVRVLESTLEGLRFTESEFPKLFIRPPGSLPTALPHGVSDARSFIEALTVWLKKQQVQENIKRIQQDILWAYFFRVPEIFVYWMVIGIMSGVLGVPVDALAIVVATHELAHAYSHLGRDIDGGRWETEPFARAELDIVEGIAQFYTGVVCRKLQDRYPAAEVAYRALLECQSGSYRVHHAWTDPDLDAKNKRMLIAPAKWSDRA